MTDSQVGVDASKFWMVWRDGSHGCSCQHYSKASAVQEAKRLAAHSPGDMFFVVKATAGFVCPVMPVVTANMLPPQSDLGDEIPF